MSVGCNQCRACRANRARLWTGRILLESSVHPFNTFLTLTLNDSCPEPSYRQWRDILGGIRYRLGYRSFLCSERGSRSGRLHAHAIVFGQDPNLAQAFWTERWPHGFVYALPFSAQAARYVSGYVVKKRRRMKCTSRQSRSARRWGGQVLLRSSRGCRRLWPALPISLVTVTSRRRFAPRVQPIPLAALVRYLRRAVGVPDVDPGRVDRLRDRQLVAEPYEVDCRREAGYRSLKARDARQIQKL